MEVTASDLARTYSVKTAEELLLLHGRGTLTDIAYDALEAELAERHIPIPPRPQVDAGIHAAKESYRRMTLLAHWRGEAPLASAYWLVGALGFWLINGAMIQLGRFVPLLTPLAVAVQVAFFVFAWVSIWRCWRNTSWPIWGYLARSQVIIFILVAIAVVISLLPAGMFTGFEERSLLE